MGQPGLLGLCLKNWEKIEAAGWRRHCLPAHLAEPLLEAVPAAGESSLQAAPCESVFLISDHVLISNVAPLLSLPPCWGRGGVSHHGLEFHSSWRQVCRWLSGGS